MGAMTSLSNRDCVALLRDWGFEEAGSKGGHMIMQYQGRRVQITAPGRATHTPYKALRKAARILGISLKDLLRGKQEPLKVPTVPLTETEEETVASATSTIEVPTDVAVYECPVCGKSDFKTERGFKGHLRAHETTVCQKCGKTFSLQGMGNHRAKCTPKRRPGHPRSPIAEPLAGRRQAKARDLGVEVPEVLDTIDETFPDPAEFEHVFLGETEDQLDDGLIQNVLSVKQARTDRPVRLSLLLDTFFPARTLDDEQTDEFLNWVEATKALFDTL